MSPGDHSTNGHGRHDLPEDQPLPFDAWEATVEEMLDLPDMVSPVEAPRAERRPSDETYDPAQFTLTSAAGEIADTAWFLLSVRCGACRVALDTDDIDGVRASDPAKWARVAGARASDQGWTAARDEAVLFCPNCSTPSSAKPEGEQG